MNAASFLTWSRLVAVPVLFIFAYAGMRDLFLGLFVLAGITDALDGYVARRTGTASRAGARLDSIADYAFFGSSVFWVFWFAPAVLVENWLLVVLLAVLAGVKELAKSGGASLVAAFHWWPSKIVAISWFVFVVCLVWFGYAQWMFYVFAVLVAVCILAEVRLLRGGVHGWMR